MRKEEKRRFINFNSTKAAVMNPDCIIRLYEAKNNKGTEKVTRNSYKTLSTKSGEKKTKKTIKNKTPIEDLVEMTIFMFGL